MPQFPHGLAASDSGRHPLSSGKTHTPLPRQAACAHVGGHNNEGVAKIHPPSAGIGELSVLQDLKQEMKQVGVRLFDLVKQHQAVRSTAHRLGELSPLLVSHVAGWRTDEARNGVLFHILRHIQANDGLFVPEQSRRQRLA